MPRRDLTTYFLTASPAGPQGWPATSTSKNRTVKGEKSGRNKKMYGLTAHRPILQRYASVTEIWKRDRNLILELRKKRAKTWLVFLGLYQPSRPYRISNSLGRTCGPIWGHPRDKRAEKFVAPLSWGHNLRRVWSRQNWADHRLFTDWLKCAVSVAILCAFGLPSHPHFLLSLQPKVFGVPQLMEQLHNWTWASFLWS